MIKRILVVTLLVAACSKGGEPPATGANTAGGGSAVKYPDTADGLKQLVSDSLDANAERAKQIDDSLVLPNAEAWFVSVFGDDAGKTAYADYASMAARIGSLAGVFAANRAAGKTDIRITKVEDSSTPGASRDQRKAMMAMKTKVPLYRVEMLAPGEDLGFSLASFAHVDGAFRFVGATRVE